MNRCLRTLAWFLVANSLPLLTGLTRADHQASSDNELCVGDFDGDGQRDVFYLTKQSGRNCVAFTRNGKFASAENRLPNGAVNGYDRVICGDFDGDGKSDLFFLKYSNGHNRIAFSRLNETFEIVTDRLPCASVNGYSQSVCGDFDGDGRDDLFFINHQTGANRIAFARGNEEFTIVNERIPAGFMNGYTDALTGDFNGDNRSDILVINQSNGTNRIAFAAENETFSILSDRIIPGYVNGFEHLIVGDLSSDGRDDLLFVSSTGSNRLALARSSENFELSSDRVDSGCREVLDSMSSAMSKASIMDVCGKMSSDWTLLCETISELLPLASTPLTVLKVVLTPTELGWEDDPANRCSVHSAGGPGLGDRGRPDRSSDRIVARDRSVSRDRSVASDRSCRDAFRELSRDRGSPLP